ncbi:YfbM family protein [Nocardioides sp.]|uniref:YfbM family protein n=1 Tax=Nocardioides sp. TaxID=35761 RepID=UPI00272903F6|nr:YfbM family protein [Nocardioides sp.]MDO9455972.1 YfbM family protein [Nocardioides sp.]
MGMILVATMLRADELAAVHESQDALGALIEEQPGDDGRSIDIDKAWHGIHFLLTGTEDLVQGRATEARRWRFGRGRARAAHPVGAESLAVLGGEPVGGDVGYGPARVLTAAQVADVAAALEPMDRETLGRRVDLDAMGAAELYPQIWDEPDVYEEYLGPHYDELRSFYLRAAAAEAAVLLSIT